MNRSFLSLAVFCFSMITLLPAQPIEALQTGLVRDSSYYDIAQVGPDEFWAAGENGVLKRIDSQGNIEHISWPYPPVNLLKIVANERYVYLGADQGSVFRYDKTDGTFIRSYYSQKFQKRCFYDMLLMEDGTLLLAGGNEKIAKAGKTLPQGFIARADPNLNFDPVLVWSNPLQFVWSLLEPQPGSQEYLATVYGGLQSTIFSSVNAGATWQRKTHIPVLIHDLRWDAGEVIYAGSKNFIFSRNGVIGTLNGNRQVLAEEGCIWTTLTLGEKQLAFAYNGSVLVYEKGSQTRQKTLRPTASSLYEAVAISPEQVLVVGHGRQMYLLDFSQVESLTDASK